MKLTHFFLFGLVACVTNNNILSMEAPPRSIPAVAQMAQGADNIDDPLALLNLDPEQPHFEEATRRLREACKNDNLQDTVVAFMRATALVINRHVRKHADSNMYCELQVIRAFLFTKIDGRFEKRSDTFIALYGLANDFSYNDFPNRELLLAKADSTFGERVNLAVHYFQTMYPINPAGHLKTAREAAQLTLSASQARLAALLAHASEEVERLEAAQRTQDQIVQQLLSAQRTQAEIAQQLESAQPLQAEIVRQNERVNHLKHLIVSMPAGFNMPALRVITYLSCAYLSPAIRPSVGVAVLFDVINYFSTKNASKRKIPSQ